MGFFEFNIQSPKELEAEIDQICGGSPAQQMAANQDQLWRIQSEMNNFMSSLGKGDRPAASQSEPKTNNSQPPTRKDWQTAENVGPKPLGRRTGKRLSRTGEKLNKLSRDQLPNVDRLSFDVTNWDELPEQLRQEAARIEQRKNNGTL